MGSNDDPKENLREQSVKRPMKNRRARDDEDCQDKVCSDAKTNIRQWMISGGGSRVKHPECPLDRETLGRNTWSLLHTIAVQYPRSPTAREKEDMREFIRLISVLYPCSYCAKEFREDISKLPPNLDSRKALSLWFCQIHNRVNAKLNKPQFDCSKIEERWHTGWKDGSCM